MSGYVDPVQAVLVSDAHLTGADGPAQLAMVAWLDRLECDELFILGDLFHHWWGFPGAVLDMYVQGCAELLRLRGRGIALSYVPGNHDFRLGDFFTLHLGADVRGAHRRDVAGVPVFLAHGDEADSSVGYAVTRFVLRSAAFDAFIRLLGPQRGVRFLGRLAGASREADAGVEPLLVRQRSWADQQMRIEGVRLSVLGHLHAPGIAAVANGYVVQLGDWERSRTFLTIGDDGVVLRRASADGCQWLEPLHRLALTQV
jgi:UDP-2,3-diacylglucosamine hydrolase